VNLFLLNSPIPSFLAAFVCGPMDPGWGKEHLKIHYESFVAPSHIRGTLIHPEKRFLLLFGDPFGKCVGDFLDDSLPCRHILCGDWSEQVHHFF